MSFKINVSNVGPIITYNNAIYTLQDMTDLFDLVEEHPEFVGVMKEHILQSSQYVGQGHPTNRLRDGQLHRRWRICARHVG